MAKIHSFSTHSTFPINWKSDLKKEEHAEVDDSCPVRSCAPILQNTSSVYAKSPDDRNVPAQGCSKNFLEFEPDILEFEETSPSSHWRKDFCCNICPEKLKQSSVLKDHLLTHRNEQPFKCDVYSKSFKISGNLKKLVQIIHTGE